MMRFLLSEDKRGNIVRLLGYHSSEADMFHEMSPKWSFFLAQMHKSYSEEMTSVSDGRDMDGAEINEHAWTWTRDVLEWLLKYPNEFRSVKNIKDYEAFLDYDQAHKKKLAYMEKKKELLKDAIMTFPDGFFWHNTLANKCEGWISDKMQNCGRDGEGIIHVLFDDKLEPHAMLTNGSPHKDKEIWQAVGKQNEAPDEKYWKYFKGYIEHMGIQTIDIVSTHDENGELMHGRDDWIEYDERTGIPSWQEKLESYIKKPIQENISINIPEKQLQPDLWASGKLKEEVRQALLKISDTFLEFLSFQVSVSDIILTGSMANYNWTKYSDIDLHILIDYSMVDEADIEFVREFFKSKRRIWNAKHSIHVKGFEVEVYPQDSAEDHVSSGIYSLQQDRWLIEPQRKSFDHSISAESVVHKAIEFQHAIDNAKSYNDLDRLVDKIWKMRKAGLNKEGEFSEENLVFKHLRNAGYLNKLISFKTVKQDQELSLAEE